MTLRIAPGFTLPDDVAAEAIALLAKRGAGKTNTGRVLAEEIHGAGVQVVVLDPVGAWWGLRSSRDGKSAGLTIPILGGAHGDVPLEATAGKLLADVVVDTGQSLVIDLSDFSKTQQRQFVVDFAEYLYQRKNRQPSLLHLVLEEADEFAPQTVRANDARMVGAIEQLVRRGRGRGIGLTMITQRSAALNKGVLGQTDVLLAMRTTAPRDRAAIAEWVEKQEVDDADLVLPSLSTLETGEAWVWNPERGILKRVRIRLSKTFDSGATPKAGQRAAAPKKVAAIDMAALGEQIAATAEKAKANDPRELQKRVRDLERELSRKSDLAVEIGKHRDSLEGQLREARETEPVEVGIDEEFVLKLRDAAHSAVLLGSELDEVANALDRIGTQTEKEGSRARPHAGGTTSAPQRAARPHAPARSRQQVDRSPAAPQELSAGADSGVSRPQGRILNALAWFESIGVPRPRRSPLAAVAGASPKSSGFEKNLSVLRTGGLLDYPERGRLQLTDAGRAIAEAPAAAPTIEQLHDAVCRMVSGPQASLLRELIRVYPGALRREELADATGYSAASSGFEKNISTLRSFELIDYPERGLVAALPVLFAEGN